MPESQKILNIPIEKLLPNPYQPRKKFSDAELTSLAASIKAYGIINPIAVRQNGDMYEIIAGERRFRAAKQAGLTEVPVIINAIDDKKMAELALIENLQREGLTPIEEAKAYKQILEIYNLTEQSLGERIGKSQSTIANKIRLLTLPESVQNALINKQISEKHARSLMTIKDEIKQNQLLERITKEKLTVKELDDIIKKEEKESDKMNEGNFFPNFNNNMGSLDNASLNSINNQSMMGILPQQPMQPEMTSIPQDTPLFTGQNSVPNMNTNIQAPIQEMQNPSLTAAPFDPIPFPTINSEINVQPAPTPVLQNIEQSTTQDMPLFTQNIPSEPTFEIPITIAPEPITSPAPASVIPEDKLTKTKNLLDQNGINYKLYSNETGHCIIIEL